MLKILIVNILIFYKYLFILKLMFVFFVMIMFILSFGEVNMFIKILWKYNLNCRIDNVYKMNVLIVILLVFNCDL